MKKQKRAALKQAMLEPPPADADPIFHALWRGIGRGRAHAWLEWARSVKPDHRDADIAKVVTVRAEEILGQYRRGQDGLAGGRLERLDAAVLAAIADRQQRSAKAKESGSKGGSRAAIKKRELAEKWQERIRPEVKRRLLAGWTDRRIAIYVARHTDPNQSEETETLSNRMGAQFQNQVLTWKPLDPETVRRFVAAERRRLDPKK